MKKLLFVVFIGAILASCDRKEEYVNEMSSVVDLAGEWYVHYDHENPEDGAVGSGELLTFNTSADDGTQMWISDEGAFWNYKLKVDVNTDDMSFSGEAKSVVTGYDITVKIMNGKITEDAITMPSGAIADSIYYEVWFEDMASEGLTDSKLVVHGNRHTGFAEDDDH